MIAALVQLVCRITKLGWFDEGEQLRSVVSDTTKFLSVRLHAKSARFCSQIVGSMGIDEGGQLAVIQACWVSHVVVPAVLQASGAHTIIGLRLLYELVDEMNHKTQKRAFTQHRKVAVSFRDHSLLQVFEISLKMLHQIASRKISFGGSDPAQESQLEGQVLEQALKLCLACISYDFIGTSPDESSEDVRSL